MSTPTGTTLDPLDRPVTPNTLDRPITLNTLDRNVWRYLKRAQQRRADEGMVRLTPPYTLNMPPLIPWLDAVERRIERSILPDEYQPIEPAEWLREDVGRAAIRFFENAADILPSEPYIYSSKSGALVAEFLADTGSMTAIITPEDIVLFSVRKAGPDIPIERMIKRGSNRLREDLKEAVQVFAVPNGQMGSPN